MIGPTNVERISSRRRNGWSLVAMLVSFGFMVGIVAVITVPVQSQTSSPSGSKIVFTRTPDEVDIRDIYVMNADDGSGVTQLTTAGEEASAAWSPDDSKIAYDSYHPSPSGNADIYVMNSNGSDQVNLTNTPGVGDGVQEVSPAWSPDGSKIAFTRTPDEVDTRDIYVMNADDGSGVTQLTTAGEESSPVWSPDGSKIAFHSYRDGNFEIYVMNANGSNQTNLTNTPGLFGEGVQELNPDWSPDGSKIAFDRSSDSGNTSDIYVMNADDGSGVTQLTTAGGEHHPAWSPDGFKIAYDSYHPFESGNADIYVMNSNGSGQTNLTNTPGVGNGVQELSPDWGVSAAAPTTETVTQEVSDGQTPTTVTTDAADDGATLSDPVETNLTIPAGVGGSVSITEASTTEQPPTGFSFLDQQVEITAPAATPNNPLTLELRIDSSKVPSGQTENDIAIFRNGVQVGDCTGASATASPDPCVSGRQLLTDGDVLITVLTSQASFWNFAIAEEGQPQYSFKGFFQPVDNPPTVNTVSSVQTGKAIPVKFSLGGDKGLQIFSSGSPSSQKVTCNKQAPSDAIEKTVNASSSSLSYNASTGKYTYLWKTDKAWVGSCRQLSVKLNDQTEHTALFKFRR